MPLNISKFKSASLLASLAALLAGSIACARANSTQTQPETGGQAGATAGSRGGDVTSSSTTPSPDARPEVVAFGDSLTAGYGLSPSQSYPALLQKRLDERGYSYHVINAGVSGDTSAGGLRRLEWTLKGDVCILILELGANDALRGQPPAETKKNLAQIIEATGKRKVSVVLAGMEAPPNFGQDYTRQFRGIFPDLAKQYDLPLIAFFLEGVGGISELNQADGIHPNTRGTEIVMENVWRVLEPLLEKY